MTGETLDVDVDLSGGLNAVSAAISGGLEASGFAIRNGPSERSVMTADVGTLAGPHGVVFRAAVLRWAVSISGSSSWVRPPFQLEFEGSSYTILRVDQPRTVWGVWLGPLSRCSGPAPLNKS